MLPEISASMNANGWQEAVLNRISGQKPAWLRLYRNGSTFTGVHPSTPGFSP